MFYIMLLDLYGHTVYRHTRISIYVHTYIYILNSFAWEHGILAGLNSHMLKDFPNGPFCLTTQYSAVVGQAVCWRGFTSGRDSWYFSLLHSTLLSRYLSLSEDSWNKVACWSHRWLLPAKCHLCSSISVM